MHAPRPLVLAISTFLLPFALAATARADDSTTPQAPLDPTVSAPAADVPAREVDEAAAVDADAPAIALAEPGPPAESAFGASVSSDQLGELRGGTDTVTQNVNLRGGVNGNSANDTVSGNNLVQGGSFGNAAGISTVIQNSGNNVLIQNSTTVSVQFAPKP